MTWNCIWFRVKVFIRSNDVDSDKCYKDVRTPRNPGFLRLGNMYPTRLPFKLCWLLLDP